MCCFVGVFHGKVFDDAHGYCLCENSAAIEGVSSGDGGRGDKGHSGGTGSRMSVVSPRAGGMSASPLRSHSMDVERWTAERQWSLLQREVRAFVCLVGCSMGVEGRIAK